MLWGLRVKTSLCDCVQCHGWERDVRGRMNSLILHYCFSANIHFSHTIICKPARPTLRWIAMCIANSPQTGLLRRLVVFTNMLNFWKRFLKHFCHKKTFSHRLWRKTIFEFGVSPIYVYLTVEKRLFQWNRIKFLG